MWRPQRHHLVTVLLEGGRPSADSFPALPEPASVPDETKEYLKVLLEHYKTLSQGIYQRIDLQQKLLNFHLIFLGIVAAVVAKDPSMLAGLDAIPFLLVVPLVLMFFVWGHSNHDMMILAYAAYLYHIVRPAIDEAVNRQLPSFEDFLRSYRRHQYSLLSILGGEYNLAILMCVASLSLAGFLTVNAATVILRFAPTWDAREVIVAILAVEMIMFVWTIGLRVSIGRRYLNIITENAKPNPSLQGALRDKAAQRP
jgi:hypothetical protein